MIFFLCLCLSKWKENRENREIDSWYNLMQDIMCMEYEDKIIVDDFWGRKENSIWSHWWDWRSEKMDFFWWILKWFMLWIKNHFSSSKTFLVNNFLNQWLYLKSWIYWMPFSCLTINRMSIVTVKKVLP